jgi:hypothetical protein
VAVFGLLSLQCGEGRDAWLSDEQAAVMAARLANDACFQRFGQRPFEPGSHPIRRVDGRFEWGRLDPAGIDGYSAEVSFGPAGERPEVEVYFSSDVGVID